MWIERPVHYCFRPQPFKKMEGYETQRCSGCRKSNTYRLRKLQIPGQYEWRLVSPYIAWVVRLLRLDK